MKPAELKKKIADLDADIAKRTRENAQLQGQQDAVLADMKAKHNVSSIAEADGKIAEYEAALAEVRKEIAAVEAKADALAEAHNVRRA